MAAASSLNPRLDMAWKAGMDVWKPAGQIDGLFERRDVPVETPQASKHPAISPPTAQPHATHARHTAGDATRPGARRRSLIIAVFVFPILWHYALSAGSPHLTKHFGEVLTGRILPVAALAPLMVLVYISLRRLLDLGMSRWWLLGFFAPFLNLWLGYRCLACPSGYARHKMMDGPGVALAIVYWLLMLAAVIFLGAVIAPLVGAIDGSNLLAPLRSWIRSFSA